MDLNRANIKQGEVLETEASGAVGIVCCNIESRRETALVTKIQRYSECLLYLQGLSLIHI